MADKEYNEIMEILLNKQWEDLSKEEQLLVESYLSVNDIINDSYLISELVDQEIEKQNSLTINTEINSVLNQAFEAKFTKKTSIKKDTNERRNKARQMSYLLAFAASIIGLIVALYPINDSEISPLEDDYFHEHTQFIDMEISLGEQTEELMNLEFTE